MKFILSASTVLSLAAATAQADTFHNTNGSIIGSLCTGLSCIEDEVFTNTPLRIKSDRINLQFEDVSSSTFPNADWAIKINDNGSFGTGGEEHFTIQNLTANTDIFRLNGDAPNNSVFVDSLGRLGLGTSLPVQEIHIAGTTNPAIRMDTSVTESWDIRTNSAYWWVQRDQQVPIHLSLEKGLQMSHSGW